MHELCDVGPVPWLAILDSLHEHSSVTRENKTSLVHYAIDLAGVLQVSPLSSDDSFILLMMDSQK